VDNVVTYTCMRSLTTIVVLMALTSTVFPSTEHVVVFFFCLLRVLEVFGLNATLIFSLIIIIIIIPAVVAVFVYTVRFSSLLDLDIFV